ncbi:Ferrous iron transport protein B [Planctomycetales bacterium 10988]|nr:Ferrous iron transport protein B [Planctomycetales bacterium 10988]
MTSLADTKVKTIALIGNPNTGKSTLFSALSGIRQRVGNYPGVTVEKKVGKLHLKDQSVELIDLPGTYSLAPRSPDEMIAVDVLLGRQSKTNRPDAVLCILDASNLERNLYLLSQILELELPTIVTLNMTDVAQERGIEIQIETLSERLGVPVIPLQANRGRGLAELKEAISQIPSQPKREQHSPFPEEFQQAVGELKTFIEEQEGEPLPRFLCERLLLDTSGYLKEAALTKVTAETETKLANLRTKLSEQGHPVPGVEAVSRYTWINTILDGLVTRQERTKKNWSERLDSFLTHRVFGTLFFVLVMMLIFQAVFSWAGPLMDLIDGGIGGLGEYLAANMEDSALKSLFVNGIIGGVGGVLVFLPQIFILFLFIAILEDCGYMARAAYLMDRLMFRLGLSGKSFIPLLSSFACAIPGVMATRVIENRRDRLVTILIAPLMSCSARLPVYTLLIAAFIPSYTFLGGWLGLQGITMFAMYLVGVVVAVLVAVILKKTILPGETPPFVMELPSYKFPSLKIVFYRMFERGWAFIQRAGTLIFAVTILIWAAAYFPQQTGDIPTEYEPRYIAIEDKQKELANVDLTSEEGKAKQKSLEEMQETLDLDLAAYQLEQSYLGQVGKWIEPVVVPLGWDWRIGCAVIASFPAREVVVGTLGVIYHLGDEQDEESPSLRNTLRAATWEGTDQKVFNVPVALSIMVFFALCAQCAATLAIIKRETNSWGWPLFTFVYMTGAAYVAAFFTYQIGMLFV